MSGRRRDDAPDQARRPTDRRPTLVVVPKTSTPGPEPDPLERQFLGRSVVAAEIREAARRLAELEWTVLISGESGVGKSLLAKLIHVCSRRAHRPFVTVRSAALPRELVEAELFGHERGAFTGATERKSGRFEAADGGTLFFDEVADLPLEVQPKLLSFLQDRTFQRLGQRVPITVDVRVIAATNQNLKRLCHEGRFREDMYFRLNVVPVTIPPLRHRREDILVIAHHVLARIAERHGRGLVLDDVVEETLLGYHWPGNVRELDNVLERATVFCQNDRITLDDLPSELRQDAASPTETSTTLASVPLRDLERSAIAQTVRACGGNLTEAARQLGLSKKGIYLKMRRLGLSG